MIKMKNYTKTINELNRAMIGDYVAVSETKNPVAKNLTHLDLSNVVAQYSLFPKAIVSFLETARNKARKEGWHEVEKELTRNMGEELGAETHGVSHYNLLIKGAAEELHLSIRKIEPDKATKRFIQTMTRIMHARNPSYVIGGIYACESTAVPELRIVLKIIKTISKQIKGKDINEASLLGKFFAHHLNTWEPGHEDGLKKTCQRYIKDQEDLEQFEKGFRDVMKTMDTWWAGLSQESRA